MTKNVLVILGAGASHELIPYDETRGINIGWSNGDRRPPLTKDIFRDDEHTRKILARYQGARNLAAPIRVALGKNEQLEPLLTQYRDSKGVPLARQFLEIPLYLEDLFAIVSSYTDQPTNYQILAHALFAPENAFDRIAFLTLNYDTLLDSVLFPDYIGAPLTRIDSYLGDRCLLIKLHGSVGWVRSLRDVRAVSEPFSYLEAIRSYGDMLAGELEPGISLRNPGEQRWLEGRQNDRAAERTLFYPAISVPLGTYDPYFACPHSHVLALESFLPECHNVLAIGTSVRDNDLLEILKSSLGSVGCFDIVDQGDEATYSALSAWRQVPQLSAYHNRHSQGFSKFIMDGGLESFIASCG